MDFDGSMGPGRVSPLAEVSPSATRLASRPTPSFPRMREVLLSKPRGPDSGWGRKGEPAPEVECSGGKGGVPDGAERFVSLCSLECAFPLPLSGGRGNTDGAPSVRASPWGSFGSLLWGVRVQPDAVFVIVGAA